MIELVGAGMVEVLTLEIDLTIAEQRAETLAMIYGGGSALKLLADTAQFVNKLRAVTNRLIGVVGLFKGGLELLRKIGAAVFAEIAVLRGKFL